MSTATLEMIVAKQTELAEMIEQLQISSKRAASAITRHMPAADLILFPGETYAGEVLGEDGKLLHWLVIVGVRHDRTDWDTQMAWAKGLGADLLSPEEAHLAHANVKRLLPDTWIWLNKPHGASGAWRCGSDGDQSIGDRSAEGAGVAVRRVVPSVL